MRSRLPWVGLGSRVWSRMMGLFTLLQECLYFIKKIPDISLTVFWKGFSSIISMGSQHTEPFFLISGAALKSVQVCFLSTGIFFVNLCFLLSHVRVKRNTQNTLSKSPCLALPWPTETEFSLHKHMISLTTTPSTAAQMLFRACS